MNKAILIGRLTRDPDSRTLDSGKRCTKFSLAVNRIGEGVDFLNIVAWDKLADTCLKYLKKGSQVAITGHILTGSYERNGVKTPTFDIVAENVEFVGSKPTTAETPSRDASIDELKEVDADDDMPF